MKSLCLLCLSLACSFLFSQAPTWRIDPYDDRFFIENIGQYDPIAGEAIHAGVDDNGTEVYYTATGFVYRHRKPTRVPAYLVEAAAEEPENEREDRTRLQFDTLEIQAHWVGSSVGEVRLNEQKLPVTHFAKGGVQLVGAKSFGELHYDDLYDHIDLSYRFHADEGIKYDLTVHPGGDPNAIVLAWQGMDALFLDANGHLHAQLGDAALIDHAPKAYLLESGLPVAIEYVLQGNEVRFHTAQYDHAQTLVIDPWIINPGFTTQGKAFDVSWDCSGNVYAFGGLGPWKVKKFNSAGVLQWTYNTNHTAWYGDLISDNLGNIYIVEGCCNGNRERLNSAGVVQWTVNNGVYEFWRLALSCDYSRLTMATAYTASAAVVQVNSLSTVNMGSGALSGSTTVSGSEPRALSAAASGNYYVLTSVGNELLARNNAYGAGYNVSNGYGLLYNGPLYANGSNTTAGQNAIAIYANFIFTTNGATLMKRDIATGALLASVAIPGGTSEQYSGVAVDNCGNVFVGSNANVYQYDVNLGPVTSMAMTGAVYEVVVSGMSQVLIAGNGLLASQNSPCVAPCHTCIILPVALDLWDVAANARHQVEVSWAVPNPQDFASYTVERSADALQYAAVSTVVAGAATHAVVDAQPIAGYSWYRLALLSKSGQITYGPAQQVWVGEVAPALQAFPNPVRDHLQVQLSNAADFEGELELVNALGQVLLRFEVDATEAEKLDISTLSPGLYTLRVAGTDIAPIKVLKIE